MTIVHHDLCKKMCSFDPAKQWCEKLRVAKRCKGCRNDLKTRLTAHIQKGQCTSKFIRHKSSTSCKSSTFAQGLVLLFCCSSRCPLVFIPVCHLLTHLQPSHLHLIIKRTPSDKVYVSLVKVGHKTLLGVFGSWLMAFSLQ